MKKASINYPSKEYMIFQSKLLVCVEYLAKFGRYRLKG
jgi:hypothetical protein